MSENESFIDEVTEEVRRDKLYLFLRRYGWIPGVIIAAIILGSIFVEIKSNNKRVNSEKLGDFLSKSLNDNNLDIKITSSEISDLLGSKSLVSLMIKAKNLEDKSKYKSAIAAYETILTLDSTPQSLRDFVKFKLLLLIKDDSTRVDKLLADLINPDNSFNLLALEQKVLKNIIEEDYKEASSNLDLLISDPKASQAMVSRANQIKKAIKFDSL